MQTTQTATAPRVSYRRPSLYPKQQKAIFCPERYGIIEGSTKCGKTVACIAWILEQAMQGKPGQSYWWISPVYPQAKIAFRRLKRGLPENLYSANESELTITLVNGSIISFKSAEKPDNLYGEDVYAAVLDEASRMREEAWFAIRSTLTATRGHIRIIGNVKGRRNWAYRLARRAEGGEAISQEERNEREVEEALARAGVRPEARAGILGNVAVETGGSFDHAQQAYDKKEGSIGLFQLKPGGILHEGYTSWLDTSNRDDSSASQVEFMLDTVYGENQDIIGAGNAESLRDSFENGTPEEVAREFMKVWERPSTEHWDRRLEETQKRMPFE